MVLRSNLLDINGMPFVTKNANRPRFCNHVVGAVNNPHSLNDGIWSLIDSLTVKYGRIQIASSKTIKKEGAILLPEEQEYTSYDENCISSYYVVQIRLGDLSSFLDALPLHERSNMRITIDHNANSW